MVCLQTTSVMLFILIFCTKDGASGSDGGSSGGNDGDCGSDNGGDDGDGDSDSVGDGEDIVGCDGAW